MKKNSECAIGGLAAMAAIGLFVVCDRIVTCRQEYVAVMADDAAIEAVSACMRGKAMALGLDPDRLLKDTVREGRVAGDDCAYSTLTKSQKLAVFKAVSGEELPKCFFRVLRDLAVVAKNDPDEIFVHLAEVSSSGLCFSDDVSSDDRAKIWSQYKDEVVYELEKEDFSFVELEESLGELGLDAECVICGLISESFSDGLFLHGGSRE